MIQETVGLNEAQLSILRLLARMNTLEKVNELKQMRFLKNIMKSLQERLIDVLETIPFPKVLVMRLREFLEMIK